jgi:damage-control phosphatase, subfamily I
LKLKSECIDCILGQAARVASKINASPELTNNIQKLAEQHASTFSFSKTPVEVATPLYEDIAKLAQMQDLYQEAKLVATKQAIEMLPKLKEMINNSPDTLLAAGKMAVAGNVIDLATETEYDLTAVVDEVLQSEFGRDDFKELFAQLQDAKTLLYLADNAGEHIFDALFMEKLNQNFPKLKITYMTRGNAIINDVTLEEAKHDGLDSFASVESSGMNTPGFILANASEYVSKTFFNADVVIAKGMGNFETMTEIYVRDVFHLFKVKCSVVSAFVDFPIGTFMAMQRKKV